MTLLKSIKAGEPPVTAATIVDQLIHAAAGQNASVAMLQKKRSSHGVGGEPTVGLVRPV